jgi:hypothetical protein
MAPRDPGGGLLLSTIKALPLLAVFVSATGQINAQPPPAANAAVEEPLQMIVDYGQASPRPRESLRGVMEPVGLPANQQVTITLQFLRKRAGSAVTIGRLDGGEIDLQGPVTVSSDGTVVFHFFAGGAPGFYRLLVQGAQQYQISLYAIDPNRPPRAPKRGP